MTHTLAILRKYNAFVMDFFSKFSAELGVAASITHPLRGLHMLMHIVCNCGVIEMELGTIDFRKGQWFMVHRADIEHLIVQGYLGSRRLYTDLCVLFVNPSRFDCRMCE